MSSYPEMIVLQYGSSELKFLKDNSELINQLELENGQLELSADLLFQGDKEMWKLFIDLFFPEMGAATVDKMLFLIRKNPKTRQDEVIINPKRGITKDQLKNLLDFLNVGNPQTMWEFARKQARKQLGEQEPVKRRSLSRRARINMYDRIVKKLKNQSRKRKLVLQKKKVAEGVEVKINSRERQSRKKVLGRSRKLPVAKVKSKRFSRKQINRKKKQQDLEMSGINEGFPYNIDN